ncbi:MAG: 50S ribosomal protein L29 [Nitrospinota bacterium]
MKASELRERTDEELRSNLEELEQELFNLRFQLVIGQLENPMRARSIRRTIARIQTILREREPAGGE